MDNLTTRLARLPRRLVSRIRPVNEGFALSPDCEGQVASDLIRDRLLAPAPCMIARFGRTELRTTLRRWHRLQSGPILRTWRYLVGRHGPYWWDRSARDNIRTLSGFFPCDDKSLDCFSDLMLRDIREIDILAAWCPGENHLACELRNALRIPLGDLEPYVHTDPWTSALAGRTVLVIHPFERSIQQQWEKRTLLFRDPRVLPDFELKTLRAMQTIGGNSSEFPSWFDAFAWMCDRIRDTTFDVAIIGAGAYGLPLAAFVKRLGKKAVHVGGATQLLFGIRGKRWDSLPAYQAFYNEHWARPLEEEKPAAAQQVEGACYW